MTEPRRVRTQAERAGDDHTWHPGGYVPGDPVSVELHPAECVLVVREGVGVMCVRDHVRHDETHGRPLPPVPDCCYPPDAVDLPVARRRWWHRLTRRNP